MALPKQVQDLFNDPDLAATWRALATISPEGVLHLIPVGSIIAPDTNFALSIAVS